MNVSLMFSTKTISVNHQRTRFSSCSICKCACMCILALLARDSLCASNSISNSIKSCQAWKTTLIKKCPYAYVTINFNSLQNATMVPHNPGMSVVALRSPGEVALYNHVCPCHILKPPTSIRLEHTQSSRVCRTGMRHAVTV